MMADGSCAKVVLSKEHPQLLTTTDAAKRDQNLVVAADHSDRRSANVVTMQWNASQLDHFHRQARLAELRD